MGDTLRDLFSGLGSEDAGDVPRDATSETWPRRHHIGGATTKAHGAKDLTISIRDEDRMIRDLHESANKKDKYFDDLRQSIEEERWPSGLRHGGQEGHDTSQHIGGATTGSWEPAAEWLKKQHRRKVNELEDEYRAEEYGTYGFSTNDLKREFLIRLMADAYASNLKHMPKDELIRMASEGATNIELEALERALGDPAGYELDPSVMNPRPEGFKHLPWTPPEGKIPWGNK